MKATGIVRKIDELGRFVIPKEIRRSFNIRNGEPLEIFVERNGEIIFKKYSPVEKLAEFAQEYTESLYEALGHVTCIADKDKIIAIAGVSKKDFLNRSLSTAVEKVMKMHKSIVINDTSQHEYYQDSNEGADPFFSSEVIAPIIKDGESIGSVIIGSIRQEVKMGDLELKLAETAAGFLAKQSDY